MAVRRCAADTLVPVRCDAVEKQTPVSPLFSCEFSCRVPSSSRVGSLGEDGPSLTRADEQLSRTKADELSTSASSGGATVGTSRHPGSATGRLFVLADRRLAPHVGPAVIFAKSERLHAASALFRSFLRRNVDRASDGRRERPVARRRLPNSPSAHTHTHTVYTESVCV